MGCAGELSDEGQAEKRMPEIQEQGCDCNLHQSCMVNKKVDCEILGRPGVYDDTHQNSKEPVIACLRQEKTEGNPQRDIPKHNRDGLPEGRLKDHRIYLVLSLRFFLGMGVGLAPGFPNKTKATGVLSFPISSMLRMFFLSNKVNQSVLKPKE